jgi:hypothetical protein
MKSGGRAVLKGTGMTALDQLHHSPSLCVHQIVSVLKPPKGEVGTRPALSPFCVYCFSLLSIIA